jgi:peroxiredoxin
MLAFTPSMLPAQNAYNIKVRLDGLKNTECYLANYFGDKQYLKDTAKVDAQGWATFTGKEKLPGGIYLIVTPSKKYFEVIIDKEQDFTVETDTITMVKSMKVKGSKENMLFYDYLNYIEKKHTEMQPLQDKLKTVKAKDSTETLRKQISAIDKDVKDYKLKFIKDHPETFVAKVFRSMQDPDVPEAPLLPDGKKDSTFAYRYFKAHFFDNVDFSDERLIRTPIIHNKIKQYLEQLTVQMPDSINKSADLIISKAKANKEIYKFAVYYVTYTYESSKIMGMDAVFVHMANNYYKNIEQAWWVTDEQLKKIQERSKTLEPLLLGKKIPNLALTDTTGKVQVLHQVKGEYTVLYFWDHGCSHCKKETPKLVEYYNKVKDKGVAVYAVETETDINEWKKYVKENKLSFTNVQDTYHQTGFKKIFDIYSTPVIYLLDKDKKIIGKRIDVENLEIILNKKLGLDPPKPKEEKDKPAPQGSH